MIHSKTYALALQFYSDVNQIYQIKFMYVKLDIVKHTRGYFYFMLPITPSNRRVIMK